MKNLLLLFTIVLLTLLAVAGTSVAQEQQIKVTGVYQGQAVFIQNPLMNGTNNFCISAIFINGDRLNIDYNRSALELDFNSFDLYTPVTVSIKHPEVCTPRVLNPEAIRFYSAFKFTDIILNDTTLTWRTRGEKGEGSYAIEKLFADGWNTLEQLPSKNNFTGSTYTTLPELKEGSNKYRIRYDIVGTDRYIYSQEQEYVYYPEPLRIYPLTVTDNLYLSRIAEYEISTSEGRTILTGKGNKIELSRLRRGEYYITVGERVEKFVKN